MDRKTKTFMIVTCAFIAGEFYSHQVNKFFENRSDTKKITIESKLINKDNVPDMIVRDKISNKSFVMLSTLDGAYEKCDMSLSQTDGSHMIYSKQDKGYYIVESGEFQAIPDYALPKK